MKRLNQEGNTTIFIIGSFSMLLLFLLIIGSLGKVFILKEHASNNAEQASIVATDIVMNQLQIAIEEYDATLTPEEYPVLSINLKVNVKKQQLSAANPSWSETEVRTKAINQVLAGRISGDPVLKGIVESKIATAEAEIPSEVSANIISNDGIVPGTKITFVRDRIQVETSKRYEAFKFDEFLPEEKRYVKQTGRGPKLEFAQGLGGWSLNEEL